MVQQNKKITNSVLHIIIVLFVCAGFIHGQLIGNRQPSQQIGARWVYTYNHAANYLDEAKAVIYGDDGNIYAAGKASFDSTAFYYDFAVIALTNGGAEVWTYNFDGTACSADEAFSIDYGDDGYLYVAGYNIDQYKSRDYTVISLPQYRVPPVPQDTTAPFFQP